MTKLLLHNGQECWHKGCGRHRTHPCETCGRIGAQGELWHFPLTPLGVHIRPRLCNCKMWFKDLTHDEDCDTNKQENQ